MGGIIGGSGGEGGGGSGLLGAVDAVTPEATYHPQGMPGQNLAPPAPVPLNPVSPTQEGGSLGGGLDPTAQTSGAMPAPAGPPPTPVDIPDPAAMVAPAPNMSTNQGPVYVPPPVATGGGGQKPEPSFWNKLGAAVGDMGLDDLKGMITAAGQAGGASAANAPAAVPAPEGMPLNPVTPYGGGAIRNLMQGFNQGRGGLF